MHGPRRKIEDCVIIRKGLVRPLIDGTDHQRRAYGRYENLQGIILAALSVSLSDPQIRIVILGLGNKGVSVPSTSLASLKSGGIQKHTDKPDKAGECEMCF